MAREERERDVMQRRRVQGSAKRGKLARMINAWGGVFPELSRALAAPPGFAKLDNDPSKGGAPLAF